jgi:hypothetical protein
MGSGVSYSVFMVALPCGFEVEVMDAAVPSDVVPTFVTEPIP